MSGKELNQTPYENATSKDIIHVQ